MFTNALEHRYSRPCRSDCSKKSKCYKHYRGAFKKQFGLKRCEFRDSFLDYVGDMSLLLDFGTWSATQRGGGGGGGQGRRGRRRGGSRRKKDVGVRLRGTTTKKNEKKEDDEKENREDKKKKKKKKKKEIVEPVVLTRSSDEWNIFYTSTSISI